MTSSSYWQEQLQEHRAVLANLDVLAAPCHQAETLILSTLRRGGKLLSCGNGGSAGDAQHLASELVNRFEGWRRPLPAVALSCDGAVLTSIANDLDYEQVFARQVDALGRSGDGLVVFSTSGNSANVLAAVQVAQERGMWILAFTGRDGGVLAALLRPGDIELRVPHTRTARIQEIHLLLIHSLCAAVDAAQREASPSPSDLCAAKILNDWEELAQRVAIQRPLVFTNGVFDLLHRGHVQYLLEARTEGACLVLAVNGDDSVRRLGKGNDRPINSLADRQAVLAGLSAVDFVTTFADDTPLRLIQRLRPEVLVKGGDWPVEKIVGATEVESWGGRVLSIPFQHERSTTSLLQRIRESQP